MRTARARANYAELGPKILVVCFSNWTARGYQLALALFHASCWCVFGSIVLGTVALKAPWTLDTVHDGSVSGVASRSNLIIKCQTSHVNCINHNYIRPDQHGTPFDYFELLTPLHPH